LTLIVALRKDITCSFHGFSKSDAFRNLLDSVFILFILLQNLIDPHVCRCLQLRDIGETRVLEPRPFTSVDDRALFTCGGEEIVRLGRVALSSLTSTRFDTDGRLATHGRGRRQEAFRVARSEVKNSLFVDCLQIFGQVVMVCLVLLIAEFELLSLLLFKLESLLPTQMLKLKC